MKMSGVETQLPDLLKKSKHVTLMTSVDPNRDLIHGVLVWAAYCKRHQKEVSIILPGASQDATPSLAGTENVAYQFPHRRTIVRVNLGNKNVHKISYEVKEGALNLFITPDSGVIKADQIQILPERLKTDLLMTFNLSSPKEVKTWPEDWVEELKSLIPIVNVDINQKNSNYGSLNIVEPNLKSYCVFTADLFDHLGLELDVASAKLLMEGITDATKQFTINTTYSTFNTAGRVTRIIEENEIGIA